MFETVSIKKRFDFSGSDVWFRHVSALTINTDVDPPPRSALFFFSGSLAAHTPKV